jgi:hypothetical protein
VAGEGGAEFGEFGAGKIGVSFGLLDGALERFLHLSGAAGFLFARRSRFGGAAVAAGEDEKDESEGEEDADPFRGALKE